MFNELVNGLATRIANSVNQNLKSQLAETGARIAASTSAGSQKQSAARAPVKSREPRRDSSQGNDPTDKIRELLEKLFNTRGESKKTGKSWLELLAENANRKSPTKRPGTGMSEQLQKVGPQQMGIPWFMVKQREKEKERKAKEGATAKQPAAPVKPAAVPWFIARRREKEQAAKDQATQQTSPASSSARSWFSWLPWMKSPASAPDSTGNSPANKLPHPASGSDKGKSGGGKSGSSQESSPRDAKGPPPSPNLISRVFQYFGRERAQKDRENNPEKWWKRGFGNGTNGSPKRSWFTRAARLKMKARRRLRFAEGKRNKLGKAIGTTEYQEGKHKAAIGAAKGAQERLSQATALEAKATMAGAAASERVAEALGRLGGGLGGLGTKLSLPLGMATLARLPWMLRDMNDMRIASLRKKGDYTGETAAIGSMWGKMAEKLNARQARDTAVSAQWLVHEQNELKKNLQPVGIWWENFKNNTAGWATKITNKFVQSITDAADEATAISQLMKEGILGPNKFEDLTPAEEAIVKKRAGEIAKKRADEMNGLGDKKFSSNLAGWEDAITWTDEQKKVKDARRNAMPKKPIPKF